MEIRRAGSQPSGKGPSDWFSGSVRIDPLFPAHDPAPAAGNWVTFEPGARTAWHTHPLGQILIVTTGLGRVQRELPRLSAGLHPTLWRVDGSDPFKAKSMTKRLVSESLLISRSDASS
jgi:hypothetical protein